MYVASIVVGLAASSVPTTSQGEPDRKAEQSHLISPLGFRV